MRPDLQKAHEAASLRGTLDEALRCPLLKRCLEITARALERQRTYAEAQPVAPHVAEGCKRVVAPGKDFKRACAGDHDE